MSAESRTQSPVRKWGGKTVMQRFMSKVKQQANGCWLWTGPLNKWGYGKFTVQRVTMAAHRFAYQELVGPIPEGLTIDHLCRVRRCVNPKHLEAVSLRENLLRGDTFQAHNHSKTHCKHGHPFDALNTRIVNGWRQCRECILIRKAEKRKQQGARVKGRYHTKVTRQWQTQKAG